MFVRLKILWFTKELFFIFQVYTLSKELFWNLSIKSIHIFSSVPISEVAAKFSLKIIIKTFQKFVVHVFKMFLMFLLKNFLKLSKISLIVMLYGASIDTFHKSIVWTCKVWIHVHILTFTSPSMSSLADVETSLFECWTSWMRWTSLTRWTNWTRDDRTQY